MSRPSLARLQRRFAALVVQPEPLEDAARAYARQDPDVLPLASWTTKPEGLAVYARMYFARLLEVMREEFERVARVVGETAFERLVADYLVRCPPVSPTLRDLGDRFAGFVAANQVGWQRPDLADLARLERARADVLDAADDPLLERRSLEVLGPEEWPAKTLRLASSVRLLELDHAVDSVWLAADRGESLPPALRASSAVLVWRRDFVAWHRAVIGGELEALRRLRDGASIAEVCDALAGDDSPEEAACRAHSMLVQWLTDAVLTPSSDVAP